MMRKFRVLGLALFAVLAVSAISATASQAHPQFTCSKYPCTATGTSLENSEEFTTPGGTVTCHASYIIEKFTGNNEDIPAATGDVTVTPTYTNCKAFGFLSASVTPNGCDYDFTATEKVAAGHYRHHVNITCPTGKAIVIVASTCEADVGSAGNESLTTVTTTNLADGRVTIEPELENITLNVTKDGIGCPFPSTGHFKGSYHGHTIIHNSTAGQTISVSGE